MTSIETAAALDQPAPSDGDLVIERRAPDPRAWCEALPAAAGRTILISGRVLSDGSPEGAAVAERLAGPLRMAARAMARVDLAPAEALGYLDSLVAEWEEPFRARLLYGVFDPVDGAFCFAQAGHPAPVICPVKGATVAPPAPDGGPLGGFVSVSASYGEQTVAIPPGGSVVLALPAELADDVAFATGGFAIDADVVSTAPSVDGVAPALAVALDGVSDPVAAAEAALESGPGGTVLAAGWPTGLTVGPVRVIELELGEGEDPTRRARAFCYGVLSTWQLTPLVRDDIVLAVSELVANALLYGGAAEQLRLRRSANRIVIEVFDREPAMPRPRIADADAESGRGLFLVRRVAARWGARAVPGGKAVWAEFDLTAPRSEDEETPDPVEAAAG
ncbi:SpoIIE family protein phosphatase [Cryptosporangium aurantiacum]|uniref:Histidine kinase-like ATPase domain-containing protein n=1 Tax=Cryptosporangium aurantiacum TaxID=134849 RepID=A0A1M7JEN4_9ACTN|nr:SpoIIE family protein phosphatase [Cryptosporangium aurantiacum]SHM51454.1 Histidine kinase-like ATPase domain-containing protein [Cryptosporangium aurantiacum]